MRCSRRIARWTILSLSLLFAARAGAVTASLTGYVGAISGQDPRAPQIISTPAGETGQVNVAIKNASDGSAYDLTGVQVLLSVRDRFGALVISRQATINSPATLGTCFFPLVIADTYSSTTPIAIGTYSYDVFVTDASGNRFQVVSSSNFIITKYQGTPGQPVTVPATQQPLAQGPQGVPGLGLARTAQTSTYTAHLLDYVAANSTAGSFTVTLPLTSSVTSTSGNIVYVKNIGSANAVTVAPGGSDTIDIGSIALAPGEVLPLIAHAGAWEALQ